MTQDEFDRLIAAMPLGAMMTPETAAEMEAKFPGIKIPPERIMAPSGNPDDQALMICNYKDMPSVYTDNVPNYCINCGAEVYHRPHVPKNAVISCFGCADLLIEQAKTNETVP